MSQLPDGEPSTGPVSGRSSSRRVSPAMLVPDEPKCDGHATTSSTRPVRGSARTRRSRRRGAERRRSGGFGEDRRGDGADDIPSEPGRVAHPSTPPPRRGRRPASPRLYLLPKVRLGALAVTASDLVVPPPSDCAGQCGTSRLLRL